MSQTDPKSDNVNEIVESAQTAGGNEGKVVAMNVAPVVPIQEGKTPAHRAPAKARVDLTQFPLSNEAFSFYRAPQAISKSSLAPKCYLECSKLVRLARCLGRQIQLDEIMQLVGKEAATDTCAATGRTFLPVWWIELTEEEYSWAARTKQFDVSRALKLGSYFLQKEGVGDDAYVVSGAPYTWRGDEQFLAKGSPMVQVYLSNEYTWGLSQESRIAEIERRVRRRARLDERKSAINSVAAALQGKFKTDSSSQGKKG